MWGQLDGVLIGDWRPDLPGLEIYMAGEENDTSLALVDHTGQIVWYDPNTYGYERRNNHHVYTHFGAGDFLPSVPGSELVLQRPDPGCRNEVGGVYSAHGERLVGIRPPEGRWYDIEKGTREGAPRVLNWDGDKKNGDEIAVNLFSRDLKRYEVKVYSFAQQDEPKLLLVVPGYLQQVFDCIGDGREELLVSLENDLFVYMNPEVPKEPTVSIWMNQTEARQRYVNPFSKN
jgi:hypothetical protein